MHLCAHSSVAAAFVRATLLSSVVPRHFLSTEGWDLFSLLPLPKLKKKLSLTPSEWDVGSVRHSFSNVSFVLWGSLSRAHVGGLRQQYCGLPRDSRWWSSHPPAVRLGPVSDRKEWSTPGINYCTSSLLPLEHAPFFSPQPPRKTCSQWGKSSFLLQSNLVLVQGHLQITQGHSETPWIVDSWVAHIVYNNFYAIFLFLTLRNILFISSCGALPTTLFFPFIWWSSFVSVSVLFLQ